MSERDHLSADQMLRAEALVQAVDKLKPHPTDKDEIVAYARAFYAFLSERE
jgi:hypothetical protein